MPLHIDARVSEPLRLKRLPSCPHCGDTLLAPLLSEFHDHGEIRHHWACESCGEPSETKVSLRVH